MKNALASSFLALLTASGVTACGGQLRPAEGETVAADSVATPTLSFGADWSVTQSAPVVAGASAVIHYDPARLPNCRAVYHGFPAWGISAYYAVDGGQAFTAPVTQFVNGTVVAVDATIVVPPGHDLAVWFSNSDEYGCSQWDSSYGNNFHFSVTESVPALHFRWPSWSVEQSAPLAAGSDILVDYDIRRLPYCRQDYNGMQTWDVTFNYRFDGGAAQSASVTTSPNDYNRVQAPARITTPTGARSMDVWFENHDRTGCQTWDSAYGSNYHFAFDR
jgi:hypothetical protein